MYSICRSQRIPVFSCEAAQGVPRRLPWHQISGNPYLRQRSDGLLKAFSGVATSVEEQWQQPASALSSSCLPGVETAELQVLGQHHWRESRGFLLQILLLPDSMLCEFLRSFFRIYSCLGVFCLSIVFRWNLRSLISVSFTPFWGEPVVCAWNLKMSKALRNLRCAASSFFCVSTRQMTKHRPKRRKMTVD